MQPYVVELPESEFITCHELALAVAFAMVPSTPEQKLDEPLDRASWRMPSLGKLAKPESDARLGPLEQVGKFQVRRPLPESPTNDWRPLTSEHLLAECARRLTDLQAWVIRKELSIFSSSYVKAQVVAPGAYLRRCDAIRYCEESGMTVNSSSAPLPSALASAAVTSPAPVLASAALLDPDSSGLNNKKMPSAAFMPPPPPSRPSTRLLRSKEAIALTGLSRSSFYERQNPKSRYFDKTFPSPVQTGQSAMGYREDELDAWIASRPQKER